MEIEDLTTNIATLNNELKNRFKLPIFVTYSIILIIYNWDILFYLAFEKNLALAKIIYVKQSFLKENFSRVWIPVLVAVLYSIIFPLIQVFINFFLQKFKRFNNKITRKEELDNAAHSFDVQQLLSGQQSLRQLQNQIDQLIFEKEKLLSTNSQLLSQINSYERKKFIMMKMNNFCCLRC